MKINIFNILVCLLALTSCNNKSNESEALPSATQNQFLQGQIVDLTHEFSTETIYWVTAKEFELDTVFNGNTDKGYYYSANNFASAEHGGTHIDAPIHFSKNGQYVNEIPLENLVGSAIKIDVSERALNNPDYLISIEDFKNWEQKENTKIPDGSIVLLQTGFSQYYPNKIKYLGTDQRGDEAVKLLHFPGLSPEAAEWLVNNRNIHAIGLDTPSIDFGQSKLFQTHQILFEQNIPAFENIANLDKMPAMGAYVVALPMKIEGGSGAPLRIIAIVQ